MAKLAVADTRTCFFLGVVYFFAASQKRERERRFRIQEMGKSSG